MFFSSYFRREQKANEDDSEIQQLRKYLLGQVAESQRTEIELRYFRDAAYYEKMLAEEDELIRGYFSGTLSALEEMQFVQHFLGSERRRKKVEFLLLQVQEPVGAENRPVNG